MQEVPVFAFEGVLDKSLLIKNVTREENSEYKDQ
jgi:hypothetical protein